MKQNKPSAEQQRLLEHYQQGKSWLKWGPYLSERQWGTVREDYSANGDAWTYFSHDHARSRVYRWGEDGLAGISDDRQRMCFAIALWNEQDPYLKERLFGLTGPQGNHGEDVKELYYYLDSTPTHSYMKHLYKYPQAAFPYDELVEANRRRSKEKTEYELLDTGVFDDNRYFDVFTEYAKASEEDLLIRIAIHNRGEAEAPVWVLPTLWFRNLWSFGLLDQKPVVTAAGWTDQYRMVKTQHPELPAYRFYFPDSERMLFTENENNAERVFGEPNPSPLVKDAFHTAIVGGQFEPFASQKKGTKFAPVYRYRIGGGQSVELRLRLCREDISGLDMLGDAFSRVFQQRQREADEFYSQFKASGEEDLANIQRQALAGMLWTKQYYNIDIPRWLNGDPGQPPPPPERKHGRNSEWMTLNNEDIISMPDKWEYPWYAAWDLAFHCIPLAMVDVEFAKNQLILFLREWYMHPNGQIPAYEWHFSDVNPPVHAWACLQVYKMEEKKNGRADKTFLKRVFHKLLLNFTWWVNQKDHNGNNIFEGGFLGLDNIGIFDRSKEIPGGGYLEQADGTAWMGMYCLNMLEMSLILAEDDIAYEDVATKFFEHFVYIAASLNQISHDWTGAWNEEEGFFYDILAMPDGQYYPLRIRSLVGLTTLFAVLNLKKEKLQKLPDFYQRLQWFRKYRQDNEEYQVIEEMEEGRDILLSLAPKKRLKRLLEALLDENEFLSPGGIRSLSKYHETPFEVEIQGRSFDLRYEPGESTINLFGGNSNWRGPVWLPMNYLVIQSLREYHDYFGDSLQAACPSDAAAPKDLRQVADDLARRLISIFTRDADGRRPVHGADERYRTDPHFRDLILFYEYFHGDDGRGLGASHQTGWTGLAAELMESVKR
jgi:hypothetical protein